MHVYIYILKKRKICPLEVNNVKLLVKIQDPIISQKT